MARKFYFRDTDQAISAFAATYEKLADETEQTGTGTARSVSIAASSEVTSHFWWTASDVPGDSAWAGTHTATLDCSTAGADITYGLREIVTSGTVAGWYRCSSTGSTGVRMAQQSEAAFSGTGIKTATATLADASADTDRYAAAIRAHNANSMMSQDFALDDDSANAWSEGPWSVGGGPTTDFVAWIT